MNISIKEIQPNSDQLKQYKAQRITQRKRSLKGGFEYVLVTSDSDLDGIHIGALLMGFIERFRPEYKGRFGRFTTPDKMVLKGETPTKWTYDITEELPVKSGENAKYFKGLGSWQKELLDFVIKKDGLENMIDIYDFDNINIINDFLGSEESDKRKNYIRNHSFSIARL